MVNQYHLQRHTEHGHQCPYRASRQNDSGKKLGFTLTEIVAVMVMISILVYAGSEIMPTDALNETAYKIQAERVASSIRWAQNYAINHAHDVELLIAGHRYAISDLHTLNEPISWPLTYSHCSGNICQLDERVYFPANLAINISRDGTFNARYLTETGAERGTTKTSAASNGAPGQETYQIAIPLSTRQERLMRDTLCITLSTTSGLVRVTRGSSLSHP